MSQRNQAGFTVIELSLAMAFLAFILMFTTTTMIQMMRTYNKGVTIKQVNQAGRSLTEDMSRAISAGATNSVNTAYVTQGKLCIGSTTYIWNPVYIGPSHTFNNGAVNHRLDGSALSLARTNGSCLSGNATLTSSENTFSLLGNQARVLDVTIEQSSDLRLVKLTFLIGTYDASEASALQSMSTPSPRPNDIFNTPYYSGGNLTCRPDSNGNFCAFGTFKTTVYVGN